MSRSPAGRQGSEPVTSPCRSLCELDRSTGRCTGCGRTLDQIARWGSMSDDEKRAVRIEIENHVENDDLRRNRR